MRTRDILCAVLVAGLALGAVGCGDDDDPVAPAAKTYFGIRVNDYGGGMGKAPTLDANFAMELTSVLPEVTINGVSMTTYGVEGNILYGYMDVPVQDPVTWEVRQDDKVVSGSMPLPTPPSATSCNGTTLEFGPTNILAPAEEYVFQWTGGVADHYEGNFETYDGEDYKNRRWSTKTTSAGFAASPGDQPRYFYLAAVNGADMTPGSTPNVRGWMDGFVSCRVQNGSYYLGLGPVRSAVAPPPVPLHRQLEAWLR